MSFTLMAQAMKLNVGNLAKKMVLIKLADQANDDGLCWPSYNTIAEACQVSRRTVIRHIKSLEDDGYLNITKTYDKASKKNFSNRYQLTIDRGVKLSLVSECHHPSDTVSISGDTLTLPSDTVSPEPIIESTINLSVESIVSKKKKLIDYPEDFEPTESQLDKMNEYGINIKLFLETFKSGTQSKGTKYKCWTSALTTWINNEIKYQKLVPVSEKPFKIDDENWSNPNAPANYQNSGYHPSHQLDKPMIDTRPLPVADNWHWKEPLPGMSVAQTTEYLKANKRKGENTNKAYQRLLVELQEAV